MRCSSKTKLGQLSLKLLKQNFGGQAIAILPGLPLLLENTSEESRDLEVVFDILNRLSDQRQISLRILLGSDFLMKSKRESHHNISNYGAR